MTRQSSEVELTDALVDLNARVRKLEEAVFATSHVVPAKTLDFSNLTDVKRVTKTLDQCLVILNFLATTPGKRGMTPDQLTRILGENLGLHIERAAIEMALYRATGRYVARRRISDKPICFEYRILDSGSDYIRTLLADVSGDR